MIPHFSFQIPLVWYREALCPEWLLIIETRTTYLNSLANVAHVARALSFLPLQEEINQKFAELQLIQQSSQEAVEFTALEIPWLFWEYGGACSVCTSYSSNEWGRGRAQTSLFRSQEYWGPEQAFCWLQLPGLEKCPGEDRLCFRGDGLLAVLFVRYGRIVRVGTAFQISWKLILQKTCITIHICNVYIQFIQPGSQGDCHRSLSFSQTSNS